MADVAYKRDIDRKVAEELGWDVEKVKENSNHLFKRLKTLMADVDIDHIVLVHLGTMYVKTHLLKIKVSKAEKAGTQYKMNKNWIARLEKYERILKGVPYKVYKKYNGRSRILNTWFTKKKNFLELEKYQNEQN